MKIFVKYLYIYSYVPITYKTKGNYLAEQHAFLRLKKPKSPRRGWYIVIPGGIIYFIFKGEYH